ncbi:MAG TPA: hypothetical protein VJL29_09480 [Thermoguttaceae bacterium]|nr:hypothetical protein [Thermoguttaceae bacterium]
MNKLLLILIGVPVVLIVVLVVAFLLASRDIAPPSTPDLVPQRANVADADNAFTYLKEAVAAADWPVGDERERIDKILDKPESDPRYVADLLTRNKEALTILDRGLTCDICQGPEILRIDDSMEYVQGWRTLSRLLWLKAMHDKDAGRWDEATTACCNLLRFGNLIQKDPGSLVHYLVGLALLGQGFNASETLALSPDMPKDQLARLAQALADVGPFDAGLVQSLKGEYQLASNTVGELAQGKTPFGDGELKGLPATRVGYVFQPNRTKQIFADLFRNYLENVSLPPAQRKLLDVEEQLGIQKKSRITLMLSPNGVGKMLVALMAPATEAILEASSRVEGMRAANQLMVACRRYEKDHGELPPTLDALVPTYLDAVPRDPFDGKPMRYVRDRAVVYSVGTDLVDGGGKETPPAPGASPDEPRNRWYDAEDAVFHLHGEPTKP